MESIERSILAGATVGDLVRKIDRGRRERKRLAWTAVFPEGADIK
jgi:hypothetical protein